MYIVRYALYNVYYDAQYNVQWPLYNQPHIMYNVQCTCIVQYTRNIVCILTTIKTPFAEITGCVQIDRSRLTPHCFSSDIAFSRRLSGSLFYYRVLARFLSPDIVCSRFFSSLSGFLLLLILLLVRPQPKVNPYSSSTYISFVWLFRCQRSDIQLCSLCTLSFVVYILPL